MNYEYAVKNISDGAFFPMTKDAAKRTVEADSNFVMLVRTVSDWREVH